MNRIKQLVGRNECLYKGGYGTLGGDLYVRQGDPSNNLYSASGIMFQGNPRTAEQLVYVKDAAAPAPVSEDRETFHLPEDGVVILFTRRFVYVANLSSREYFKYRR